MIRLYFHPAPNPAKVALFLEEAGLPYETIPVDTAKGEQHAPAFRAETWWPRSARRWFPRKD